MGKHSNDCGMRNDFGYYDARAQEILLKRPCFKKKDIEEALSWIDQATDLNKIVLGIGALENVVVEEEGNNVFGAARGVIRRNVSQTMGVDNVVLKNILLKLQNKKSLRNVALKCYLFSEDKALFDTFLTTLKTLNDLVYLDLGGCYFSDEQLIELADVVASMHIAHLVWPEPRMSELVLKRVVELFKTNRSIAVMTGVPLELQQIAEDNRAWLFDFGKRPAIIKDRDIDKIKEYAASLRIAIAFEKQRLFDMEKAVEAVLA